MALAEREIFRVGEQELERVERCPLCGDARPRLVRRQGNVEIYRHVYPAYGVEVCGSFGDRELVECGGCGHFYWTVIPDIAALPSLSECILDYTFDARRSLTKKARYLDGLLQGRAPARVVDVGCCRGELLLALRGLNADLDLVGIEPSLERSETRGGVRMLKGFFGAGLPIEGGSVDLVTAIDCLEHLKDLTEAFDTLDRLLKPDGMLYFETPNPRFWLNRAIRYHNMNLFWLEHYSFFTESSIRYVAKRRGYRVVALEQAEHVRTGRLSRVLSGGKTLLSARLPGERPPFYVAGKDQFRALLQKDDREGI